MTEPLSEAIAQDVVYARCYQAKHEITVPNCGSVWGPEADVASVTKSRLGHAFEIKVSRADWLSELRQIRGDRKTAKRGRCDVLSLALAHGDGVMEALNAAGLAYLQPPSYFWMVTAPGIIQGDELPEYAGLLELEPYRFGDVKAHGYMLREVRPAPRLHRLKMANSQIMAMARGVTIRYWNQRKAG